MRPGTRFRIRALEGQGSSFVFSEPDRRFAGKRLFRNMKVDGSFEPARSFRVCCAVNPKGGIPMRLKTALVGLAALVVSAAFTPVALAMPNGLPPAQQLSKSESTIEQVR